MNKFKKNHIVYFILNLLPMILYSFPSLQEKLASSPDFSGFLLYFPYVSIGFIGLAGYKYNQARVLMISLLLGLGYYSITNPDTLLGLGLGQIRLRQIFSLAYPLGITLILLIKENPLYHRRSILQLFLGFFPLLFFTGFFIYFPHTFNVFVNANLFKLKGFINFSPILSDRTGRLYILYLYP